MNRTIDKPRLGFLGAGWIGLHRLQAIMEQGVAEIVGMCDPAVENMKKAVGMAPGTKAVGSLEALLTLDLDGVVIATPSALHAEQTMTALAAGCAVFCQKPLGRNASEVGGMIDAAEAADRLLGVDLSYRHTKGLAQIRELVQGGELGKVFAANLVFHNAYGPQSPWFYDARLSGGGCVIDLGIHLVDAALWILDSPVVEVSSRVMAQGQPVLNTLDTVEDFATARLDLACGATVQMACSWRLHAGCGAVIEAAFYGTKGGAAMRNVNGSFVDFCTVRFQGVRSETLTEPPDDWGGRAAVAWVRQLAEDRSFDSEIKRQVYVASALDAIYGRQNQTPPLQEMTL